MTTFFNFLAEQPIMFAFLLIGVGMAFGHIKVKGISLGAAAVLFVAIIVAAWANSMGISLAVPPVIGTLGLTLFAYAIGINSGQSFFHNLRTAIGPILTMLLLYCVVAVTLYLVGTHVFHMEPALIGGIFAGATTNTPALGAAGFASGNEGLATVGYSITYLYGVIGMMGFAFAALAYRRRDTDLPSPIANRTVQVERSDHPFVGDLYEKMGGKVAFSRLRRGHTGPVTRPSMADTIDPGDLVTIVGPRELVAQMADELGKNSSDSLTRDRSYLDFRRITVSNPKIAGHKVGDLKLGEKFSATISRVRRGDVDMVGEPGLVLQLGDRVRVVGPTSKMSAITKYFGDSAKGLSDINPMSLGLGIALGIAIGHIPIPIGGGNTFSIGAAAGALIVGLVFGRIGRIGGMVTAVPFTACQVMIELGLLLFLAQAGSNAGAQILQAFSSGTWVEILLMGIIGTTILGLGLYVIMRWVFKMGGTRLSGVLAGAQTQPAVLAFADSRTDGDPRVALGYALVYPVAMIGKILVAQVLGGM